MVGISVEEADNGLGSNPPGAGGRANGRPERPDSQRRDRNLRAPAAMRIQSGNDCSQIDAIVPAAFGCLRQW